MFECPSAIQVPECPGAFWVLSKCPSARVLSESLKCSSASWVSLNAHLVPEYLIRCDLNKMLKHKNMLDVKRKKWKRKKMVEKNLRSLILKQYQSADLKSFWNWFGISDLCKDFYKILLFVWASFISNFRLALMILTLTLNKKRSSEMHFKQIIRRI